MASITQKMRYHLSLIHYTNSFGVTKAAVKYKTNRQYIYLWMRRFDDSIESLCDRSRRPHHYLKQHTPDEIKSITHMRRCNPDAGHVVFSVKLMQRGYSPSIPDLYRFLCRQSLIRVKLANPKYIAKLYEQMQYPGQRIQIDVKLVPSLCLVNESQGSASISTLPLMNIPDGVSLRLFRSIVSIPPACFLNTLSRFSPVQLNVYRLTTGRSSQSALVLTAAQINLPFSRSALWSMRSGIS